IQALLACTALFFAPLVIFATASTTPPGAAPAKPTIFVCGDSTSKFAGNETITSEMQGWGTPTAKFFDSEKVKINNVGHAGTSSLSYYNGDWPRVLPQIKAGDYVLIVFGINDGSTLNGIGEETRPVARGGTRGSAATTPASPAAVEHTYGWYMA